MRLSWSAVSLLTAFILLVAASSVRADDKSAGVGLTTEGALKAAKSVAKKTQAVIAVAELLDELTKTKGELVLRSTGKNPVVEKTYFGVEFRVPEQEFEDSVTNTVFGKEVPGRRVSVKIWVDCNVDCRVDVANIRFAKHEEYEDTVVIALPKLEVIGRVPEGREYKYEIDYGQLRAKWLDSEDAHTVRKQMVEKAARKAADEFSHGGVMEEFRKEFKRELRGLL